MDRLIVGWINERGEAVVSVPLLDADGNLHAVSAVVDTGFTGALTLQPSVAAALGLTPAYRGTYVGPDGAEVECDVYEVTVVWFGERRDVSVESSPLHPLVGLKLLAGCELRAEFRPGGAVEVRPVPPPVAPADLFGDGP